MPLILSAAYENSTSNQLVGLIKPIKTIDHIMLKFNLPDFGHYFKQLLARLFGRSMVNRQVGEIFGNIHIRVFNSIKHYYNIWQNPTEVANYILTIEKGDKHIT